MQRCAVLVVQEEMILALMLGVVRYHFQALDFTPNDINEKGWIVGETRSHGKNGLVKSAVLLRNGLEVDLGTYGGSGSARAVNNRGHILIQCDEGAVPRSMASKRTVRKPWDPACLFWANGKTTYLGQFNHPSRFLDSDRFLSQKVDDNFVVKVVNRKPIISHLPNVPPQNKYKSWTGFSDMNESGTVVGGTDYGMSRSHAIVMSTRFRVTDLHPYVEMHTWWSACFINSQGAVMGYHSNDSSTGGGGAYWIWRKGTFSEWQAVGPGGLAATISSFNDADQAIGSTRLFEFGSVVNELESKEGKPPYPATATSHAILLENGKFLDLNGLTDAPPDCELTTATKINNKGCIIGTCIQDKKRLGFLLTPLPR